MGVELGPDESEVVADFKPIEREHHEEVDGVITGDLGRRVRGSPPPVRSGGLTTGKAENRSLSPDHSLPISDGVLDRDSVYKAFVRQWCFAEGPPAPLTGNGGLVVG